MAKARESREDQLKRIAENAARAQGKPVEGEAPAAEREAPEPDPDALDLDDPVTQEKILHPEGTDVQLSYGNIRLYPPSAMVRRLAFAFCQEIIADAAETRPSSANLFAMRTLSKIMGSAAPQIRLFRLMASMCGKPGTIDAKTELELATELSEKAAPDDVSAMFTYACTAAGIRELGKSEKK